jgi:hypothetical protein
MCSAAFQVACQCGYLLSLLFRTEDGAELSLQPQLIFSGLHGLVSQRVQLFITKVMVVFPSTQRNFRRFFFYYLYYLNCYMFRSYDHLQAEIYLLGFTGLTTDPLFIEYS